MEYTIQHCSVTDIDALRNISIQTYRDTFSEYTEPEVMQTYLDEAFSVDTLKEQIMNVHSLFFFLMTEHGIGGYCKINEFTAQKAVMEDSSMEIERLYVIKGFQGKGAGAALMEHALQMAHAKKKKYVWLGAWENNYKAHSFYRKNGFREVGVVPFVMADKVYNDLILRRDLDVG